MTSLRVISNNDNPTAPQQVLITLPIVLIALLKFQDFGVQLNRARDGSSTWYFRFSPTAVLEVRDDGEWSWRRGSIAWRARIAPFLVRAEAVLSVETAQRGNTVEGDRCIEFA